MDHASRHGNQAIDRLQHDRISRPERQEDGDRAPLNPVAAWSIILLASIALWCGLALAVSSLVSALV
jgi:hypothetical protein